MIGEKARRKREDKEKREDMSGDKRKIRKKEENWKEWNSENVRRNKGKTKGEKEKREREDKEIIKKLRKGKIQRYREKRNI